MSRQTYKLGKLPARLDTRTIRLPRLLRKELLPTLPDSFDIDASLGMPLYSQMYGNDQYGDCVIAGRAHQTLRFEYFEQKAMVPISDQDVINEYFRESGGVDSGLDMLASLNAWRKGWTAAYKAYNIYAFASAQGDEEVKYSILLLNGLYAGIMVPQSAIDQFDAGLPWTVTPYDGGIVGGHCIYLPKYESNGLTCMTWAKRQPMTWDFFHKYCDESYAIVDNRDDWLPDSPVDVVKLDGILQEITSIPNPTPPPPTPSPCPFGRGSAKALNIVPKTLGRKGRFYYLNP